MSGMVPPGVTAYNYLLQQNRRQTTVASGLQLKQLQATEPSGICGKQLDSTVAVGGVGNIPITPNSINPANLQNNNGEFVAPTFATVSGNPNLVANPTAFFGYFGWTIYDNHAAATYAVNGNSFSMSYSGSGRIDSGFTQTLPYQTPASTLTLSGVVEVDSISGTGTEVYVDIFDANIGYTITPVNITATQSATYFHATFTVPADGSVILRCRAYNGASGVGHFSALFSQLKIEAGSTATAFSYTALDAVVEDDITGAIQSLLISRGFTNIPTNSNGQPAAVAIEWYLKNTLSSVWIPWASTPIPGIPFPSAAQTLSFGYGQITKGVSYDLGCAYVDLQGNIGPIGVLATALNPSNTAFSISSSYQTSFATGYTPTFASTPTPSTPVSANGTASSLAVTFVVNNQPVDGSLSRISLWCRPTPPGGSSYGNIAPYTWAYYGSMPAAGVGLPVTSLSTNGTYTFTYGDLVNGVNYDFAMSAEDTSGGESPIVYMCSSAAATLLIPTSALASAPSGTNIEINLHSGTTPTPSGNIQSGFYMTAEFDVNVYTGSGTSSPQNTNPSPWLAQVNFLAKPLPVGASPDSDLNPKNYITVGSFFTDTIVNPFTVTIGPFNANQNYEIAVQLVDQAGNQSQADPISAFGVQNGTIYDSAGNIGYTNLESVVGGVVSSSNALQPSIVGRANTVNVGSTGNIIFNPTAASGLNGWTQDDVGTDPGSWVADPYNSGRFYASYTGSNHMDSLLQQTLAVYANYQYVISGSIEIDTIPGSSAIVGLDLIDVVSGSVCWQYYLTATQGATYFEEALTIPSDTSSVIIRLHIRNGSGGNIIAYYYGMSMQFGSVASPYQDSASAKAVTQTHNAQNQLLILNTQTGGTTTNLSGSGLMPFTAQTTSIQDVISDTTNSYNANLAASGTEIPYYANSSAVQNATGSDSQITNGKFLSFSWSSGTLGITFGSSAIPNGGTWQFYFTLNATAASATSLTMNLKNSSGGNPSGFTSAQNVNSAVAVVASQNTLVGTAICSGGQTVYLSFTSSGALTNGVFTVQAFQIS